ncbi:unnamed protein product [Ceratitis capitata]|uniref:(Mediterranean fruit fly) hypothetical protein n=1 Tax=Ceratitis capitata TaxID=7213 RepID=A0A811VGE0_CERCA|nr:unnamed protein product [Ceratitis capitata]
MGHWGYYFLIGEFKSLVVTRKACQSQLQCNESKLGVAALATTLIANYLLAARIISQLDNYTVISAKAKVVTELVHKQCSRCSASLAELTAGYNLRFPYSPHQLS